MWARGRVIGSAVVECPMLVFSPGRSGGRLVSALVLLAVLISACAPIVQRPAARRSADLLQTPPAPGVTFAPKLHAVAGPIPFPFEENHGQTGPDIAYLLRAGDLQAGFG